MIPWVCRISQSWKESLKQAKTRTAQTLSRSRRELPYAVQVKQIGGFTPITFHPLNSNKCFTDRSSDMEEICSASKSQGVVPFHKSKELQKTMIFP